MFQCEELKEEVCGALEEVLRVRREAEEQISNILDAEGLEEAKQLYLIHQVCVVWRQESGESIFKTILKLHSPLLQNYVFSPLTFCFSFLYVYYSTTLSACILTGERRSFWWPTAASCRKARGSVSLYMSWRELSEMSTTNQGRRSTTCRYFEPGVF